MALKYTGIYPMLSEEVQEFLGTRGDHTKKDPESSCEAERGK